MSSERDPCEKASHRKESAHFTLAALRKRSQIDFEIEFFEQILSRDANYVDVLINLGDLFSQKGCFRRALQVDLRLAQLRPLHPTVFYNLACSHAVVGQLPEALSALDRAAELGYDDLDHLLTDPDLAGLRSHPGFQRVLVKLESRCAASRVD